MLKLKNESIKQVLVDDVIKRELFKGDKALDATKRITKFLKSQNSSAKVPKSKVEDPFDV